MKTLIISHYNEPLQWVKFISSDTRVIIETKGEIDQLDDLSRCEIIKEPLNVGREASTIARYYTSYPDDHVMFLQGHPVDGFASFHLMNDPNKPRHIPHKIIPSVHFPHEFVDYCCKQIDKGFETSINNPTNIVGWRQTTFFPSCNYVNYLDYTLLLTRFMEKDLREIKSIDFIQNATFVRGPLSQSEKETLKPRLDKICSWILSPYEWMIANPPGAGHDYSKAVFLERTWPFILERKIKVVENQPTPPDRPV